METISDQIDLEESTKEPETYTHDATVVEEVEIEEMAIDGICGVY